MHALGGIIGYNENYAPPLSIGAVRLDLKVLTLNISGLLKKAKHIKQIIRDFKCDFLLLQETNIRNDYMRDKLIFELGLQKGKHSFSYSEQQHSGTCIIQTSYKWKVTKTHNGLDGRLAHVDINNDIQTYSIISTYVPCDGFRRIPFLEKLEDYLVKYATPLVILGGDFNCTLQDIDITGRRGPRTPGRRELQHLIGANHLKDAYRTLFPDTVVTTHTNTDKKRAARIDTVYVHDTLKVQTAKHLHNTLKFTDHSALYITIGEQVPHTKRTTHWKFNDSLLESTTLVEGIRHILNNNFNNFLGAPNKIGYFELLKSCITKLAQQEGTLQKQINNSNIKLLEYIVNLAEAETLPYFKNSEEHTKAQDMLDNLNTNIYRGAQVRSKLFSLDNEQPNSTFLKLEDNIQGAKDIHQITDSSGNTTSDPTEIAHVFKTFYDNLYKQEETDVITQNNFLDHCKHLDNNTRDSINFNITKEELFCSINKLNVDSSPGPDGLTSKFYLFFSKELVPFLEIVYSQIYTDKQLPSEHQMSYITLLPKDSGSLLFPKQIDGILISALIQLSKGSMVKMYRIPERGSPCLTPRSMSTVSVRVLLIIILDFASLHIIFIQFS